MFLVIFTDNGLGKSIRYANHSHIPIFLSITQVNITASDDTLRELTSSLVAANHLACLDLAIPLLLYEDVRLKDLVFLLLG